RNLPKKFAKSSTAQPSLHTWLLKTKTSTSKKQPKRSNPLDIGHFPEAFRCTLAGAPEGFFQFSTQLRFTSHCTSLHRPPPLFIAFHRPACPSRSLGSIEKQFALPP